MKNQQGVISVDVLRYILEKEKKEVEEYLNNGWLIGIVVDFEEKHLCGDVDLKARIFTKRGIQEFLLSAHEDLGRYACDKIMEALKSTIYRDEKHRIVALKVISDREDHAFIWHDLDHFKILGKVQINNDITFGFFEWFH